jgi:hypothetical protein
MKICLIMPPMPFGKAPIAPLALEYLAALTKREMPDAEIELLDGTFNSISPEDIDADIVGISCKTATVTWGYQLSDELRKRGIPVVLGGSYLKRPRYIQMQWSLVRRNRSGAKFYRMQVKAA